MSEIVEAYPLTWPSHWERTPESKRLRSAFRTTFGAIRDSLLNEIRLLGGRYPVISSNIELKNNGFPYANKQEPDDPGIAVYFELFGKQQCIPCDKWKKCVDNISAIEKTVNALRGIERWGAKQMVEAAFRGFDALPNYANDSNRIVTPTHVDYFSDCTTEELTILKFRSLAKKMHPDVGGDSNTFIQLNDQYNKKLKSFRNHNGTW